jgi:hypothetical protein
VWTPKRILVLALGFVAFFAAYVAYGSTFIGRLDGLPPLPEAYWPGEKGEIKDMPARKPVIELKLQQAFGPKCEELKRAIRLSLHARNMVLAATSFEVMKPDGKVKLTPLSVGLFGKEKGDGRAVEISTISCDVAYLTFDRKISNISEISGRKIVAAELNGRIRVVNNRRRAQRDEDLVVTIPVGPVYYDDVRHRIWTSDRVHLEDFKSKPQPHDLKGHGMEMELQVETPAAQPGAPRQKRGETISGVKRIVLRNDVDMHLYVDGDSRFLAPAKEPETGKGPAAVKGPTPAKPKPPPAEKAHVHIRTPGTFDYQIFKDHDTAVFDVPAHPRGRKLSQPEDVTVIRHHPQGGTDQLICKHLNLLLRRKDPAASGTAPARPAAATSSPGVESGVDVETAHATAPPNNVVLTSDAEKLVAHGNDFFYDARRMLTILKGEPSMVAEKDGNLITARELQVQEVKPEVGGRPAPGTPAPKGHQQITAYGPGQIDMVDRNADGRPPAGAPPGRPGVKAPERRPIRAIWSELLTSTKDGPLDLLVLTGDAQFIDSDHDQNLKADVLKVWLGPGEVAKTATPAGTAPGGRRPQHVDATGNVEARSKEMHVHDTSKLVVWFRDVPAETLPGGAKEMAGGKTAGVGRSGAPSLGGKTNTMVSKSGTGAEPKGNGELSASGGVAKPLPVGPPEPPAKSVGKPGEREGPTLGPPEPVKPEEKARPIDLKARTVEAWVLRSPVKNSLEHLRAEGSVHVRQDPAKPEEKDTDVQGDVLQMWSRPEGNFLVVSGDMGELRMDKIYIVGPEVNIDQVENKSWVYGPGAMMMDSNTDFQGAPLAKPVPLTVHWDKRMFFKGDSAEFLGGIQADQQNARLACHHLHVFFDKKVSLKEGNKGEQPAKVRDLICDGDVRIEDSAYEGDRLMKYQIVHAQVVEVRSLEPDGAAPRKPGPGGKPASDGNEVHASGGGSVRIVQRGGTDPAALPAPGAPAPRPPAKPATPAKLRGKPAPGAGGKAPAESDELKLTYVTFGKRMDANSRTNTAQFWENVRVLNLPCDEGSYKRPIDFDVVLATELPEGAMYLSCARLKVLDRPENGKPNQQMEAYDRVYVQGNSYYARADAVFYNQAKSQIILEGRDGGMATLFKRTGGPGSPYDRVSGKKILYYQQTGRTEVFGADDVSGISTPSGPPAPTPPKTTTTPAPGRPGSR